jgi:hypothetical protein
LERGLLDDVYRKNNDDDTIAAVRRGLNESQDRVFTRWPHQRERDDSTML